MKIKNDWNPDLYLKFDRERNQPSIDLISRINYANPSSIADIGCGPGNSTKILSARWPDSNIVGIDNSPAMIEKAIRDFPDNEWRLLDAGKDVIEGKFDIVFSNATIQWIPDHYNLLRKFKDLLAGGGLVAIQLPMFFDMPIGKSIITVSKDKRWAKQTETATNVFTMHNFSTYYDYLSGLYQSVEMWESNYIHVMDSHDSILEMVRGAGLRPYVDRLDNENDKADFETKVLSEIIRGYPLQKNGKVLFPFKRLFFIAGN